MRIQSYSSNIKPEVGQTKAYALSKEYQSPILTDSSAKLNAINAVANIGITINKVREKTKELEEDNTKNNLIDNYTIKNNAVRQDLLNNDKTYENFTSEDLQKKYESEMQDYTNKEISNKMSTLPKELQYKIQQQIADLKVSTIADLDVKAFDRAKINSVNSLQVGIDELGKQFIQTNDQFTLTEISNRITNAVEKGIITEDEGKKLHDSTMNKILVGHYQSIEQTYPDELKNIVPNMKIIVDPKSTDAEKATALKQVPGFNDLDVDKQNSLIDSLEKTSEEYTTKNEEENAYRILYNKFTIDNKFDVDKAIATIENPKESDKLGITFTGNSRDGVLSRLDRIASKIKAQQTQSAQDILNELGTDVDNTNTTGGITDLRTKINDNKILTNAQKNVLRTACSKRTKELQTTNPATFLEIRNSLLTKLKNGEQIDYLTDIAPYVGNGISTKEDTYFRKLIKDGPDNDVETAITFGQKEIKDEYDRRNISDRSETAQYQFKNDLQDALTQKKKNDTTFNMKNELDTKNENSTLNQVLANYKLTDKQIIQYVQAQTEADAQSELNDILSMRVGKLSSDLQKDELVFEATKNVYNKNRNKVNDTTVKAEINRIRKESVESNTGIKIVKPIKKTSEDELDVYEGLTQEEIEQANQTAVESTDDIRSKAIEILKAHNQPTDEKSITTFINNNANKLKGE